ncbi:MAG: hypothetical protein IJO11_01355, partial [Alphaproteobacteria bacterium]|nr:hypothetical protein [Alphaproteobacteria bacterium]
AGSTEPTICPKGTYRTGTGGYLETHCTACPAGKYCPTTEATVDCPIGHYCPINSYEPTMCPVGTYQGIIGKSALSDCIDCSKGWYCPTTSEAVLCPAGYYCPMRSTDKIPCPEGTYRSEPAAYKVENCEVCPETVSCPPGSTLLDT